MWHYSLLSILCCFFTWLFLSLLLFLFLLSVPHSSVPRVSRPSSYSHGYSPFHFFLGSLSSFLHPLFQPHLSMVTCCFADGFLCQAGCHWLLSAARAAGSSNEVGAPSCGCSSDAAHCLMQKSSDSELMTVDSKALWVEHLFQSRVR